MTGLSEDEFKKQYGMTFAEAMEITESRKLSTESYWKSALDEIFIKADSLSRKQTLEILVSRSLLKQRMISLFGIDFFNKELAIYFR